MASLRTQTAVWIATALGAGRVPIAPGSAGALVGLALAYGIFDWTLGYKVLLWSALSILGVWAAGELDRLRGSSDHSSIVIDEVVGMGITALACDRLWLDFIIAYGLFRFFDIAKIPPVRQVDQWSKIQSKVPGASVWRRGFGVVADDVGAGLQGLLVLVLLKRVGLL